MKIGNHNYFLSWREPWHKFEVGFQNIPTKSAAAPLQDWDWFNGRNFCRDRCMDLVSFDTPGEFKMFEEIMARGECSNESSRLIYIWFYSRSRGIHVSVGA